MAIVHSFDPPQRFVAGTVGLPGQRRFYLQARHAAGAVISVACEKQQVSILAQRVGGLLDELAGSTRDPVPALTPVSLLDVDPLELPVDEQFVAGSITLSWDSDDERVVIELFPVDSDDDEGFDEMVLIRMTASQARAFANRGESVVAAGRPPCQFCGNPVDAEGHLCPRANGFRRTLR